MKDHAALLALLALASCSLPGLDDPTARFQPELTLYRLSGSSSLQSNNGGTITDNPKVDVRELGQNKRDGGDIGGTLSFGNGLSSVDLSYLHIALAGTRDGTMPADWGAIRAGAPTTSRFTGDELRASYHGELFVHKWKSGLETRFAPGVTIAHRELSFRAQDGATGTVQRISFKDEVTPYVGARARVAWKQYALDLQYAIDPGVHFGGDFRGTPQDLAITARYAIEDQDVSLLFGYRRAEWETRGSEAGLRFENDLVLDGWFVAICFAF